MPEPLKPKRIKPIVGGVLSGGLSSRMGQPKDRIVLPDGKNMIQHVVDALLLVCNEVIVAGPDLPLTIKETDRIHFVKDKFPGSGPLAGVEAILATGIARGYLISACDQPLLNEEILRMLIPDDRDMPCFFDFNKAGYIDPFPGYYPVKWLPEVRDSLRRNRRSIKSLIADSDVILRPVDEATAPYLRSINNQEELKELLEACRTNAISISNKTTRPAKHDCKDHFSNRCNHEHDL